MMTLGLLAAGEQCEIIEIRPCGSCGGGCHENDRGKNRTSDTRVEDMGLRPGKHVAMLKNDGNLLLLMVDNARIAIDRRMAMKILIRRKR